MERANLLLLLLLGLTLRLDAVGHALAELGDTLLVLSIRQVVDVHPGVRHLVDGAVAVADPLFGVGVVLVRLGVVVPGGDVDDLPFGSSGA